MWMTGNCLMIYTRKREGRRHFGRLDVHGSLHHSQIYKEKSSKMQQCIRILLFCIYMKLNMFWGGHTAHHQEPKNALAASGFAYMEGCLYV